MTSSATEQSSKSADSTAGELIERVASAIMREAKLLNDPDVQRDFEPGFIDSTRVWARKYAAAAIEAHRGYLLSESDMVSPMATAYQDACGKVANRYGMAAARNALLSPPAVTPDHLDDTRTPMKKE